MSLAKAAILPREGDILAGKYRVERVLGAGGMGIVVAAHHISLDERVALKFLLPDALVNPEAVARFVREARAAAKIKSEHVARVTDVGQLENGAPYMVMEYLEGEDLAGVLLRRGPLPVDLATGYVLEATEALAEAHAIGIVHRDLKPANLFLANRPSGIPLVKVLDFGISKSTLSVSQAQLTKTSAIMGSPLYMSPEQMTSAKSVDVRSDIWALGVVLYELLSGRTPFQADSMPELVATILQREPDRIESLRPDVPAALADVLHRCLDKAPSARFPNVAELANSIAVFGPPRSEVLAERISLVLGVRSTPPPTTQAGTAIRSQPPRPVLTNAPWSQSVPGISAGRSIAARAFAASAALALAAGAWAALHKTTGVLAPAVQVESPGPAGVQASAPTARPAELPLVADVVTTPIASTRVVPPERARQPASAREKAVQPPGIPPAALPAPPTAVAPPAPKPSPLPARSSPAVNPLSMQPM